MSLITCYPSWVSKRLCTCIVHCISLLWERLVAPTDARIASRKEVAWVSTASRKILLGEHCGFQLLIERIGHRTHILERRATILGYVPTLFAHTGSPVKWKAVGDLSRYRKSQAARCRKICAEPGSSRSADEEDNKSDIGNGACERSIMTDLSGEDILKLQDEL